MTLSRGPYNELDKMSLFQDLKLKRRKVDSRCSSDGESIADTSTSSPDLHAPLSPKMCDGPNVGNQSGAHLQSNQNQSSSASSVTSGTPPPSCTPPTPIDHHSSGHGSSNQLNTNRRILSVSPKHLEENNPTTTSDQSARAENDTKPNFTNGSNSGASVIRSSVNADTIRPRSHSPEPSSPIRRSPFHPTLLHQQLQSGGHNSSNSPHHIRENESPSSQHVTVLVTPPRVKNESNFLMNAMTRKLPPTSTSNLVMEHSPLPLTTPLSGLSQLQQHHQLHQVQIPFPPTSISAQLFRRHQTGQTSPNNNSYSPPTSQPQSQTTQQFIQQRIKRERSPNQSLTIIPSHHPMRQPSQMSPHQIPISSAATVLQGSPIQMRAQMQGMREAAMLFRIKNEPQMQIGPPAFMSQHNVQQRMAWGPQARINGVKPEVIGGPLPSLRQNVSPQSSPQQTSPNQTPPSRSTPTVIMGESCGVRTMVWGFEPVMSSPPQQQVQTPTPPNQTPPSTSQNSNHSTSSNHSSSNNEEAAHLLLSLGQGARNLMDVSYTICDLIK